MVYQDTYTIIIKFDGDEVKLDPENYSLAIKESINSLFPTVTLTFADTSGDFQEVLAFSSGLEIEISFGDKRTINTAKYIIDYDYLDQPQFPGYLTGKVDVFLIHNMSVKQTPISKAYKNRISLIIKDIMGKYGFAKLDINDTGNQSTWYQTLISDAKFIQERLLPFAFSTNANKTPFYSFITNNNEYHFRNYQSMIDAGADAVIEYKIVSNDKSNEDVATGLKRWKTDLKSYYKTFNRDIYSIDKKTGDLISDKDSIIDYPKENNLKLPIINVNNDSTGYIDEDFTFSETGDTESIKGFRVHEQRKSTFIDQFIILQPFNPKLHAGVAVKLNVYSLKDQGQQLSTTFAGLYLIEECEQIWDGEGRRAYTKLIIGRKYLNVPNTQLLKGKLK